MKSSILICDASSTTSLLTGTVKNISTESKTGFDSIPKVDRIIREPPSSLCISACKPLVSLSEIISLFSRSSYR